MRKQGANPDAVIAVIAARQHGVVTFVQLLEAGLVPSAIHRRVEGRRLHRLFRGVYAVGHRGLSNEGRWLAAVLACGEGTALSHRSAAGLWRILPPLLSPVHVTICGDSGRSRRPGIHLHRSPSLLEDAVTRRNGIAVTTPARTIRDLSRTEAADVCRQATRKTEYLGLDLGDIETDRTRSELELEFLRLCRRHRLPMPEVNARVGPFTVDFLWLEQRLVVETDGWQAHRGRQAFEDDRERDVYLIEAGYGVLRFTWRRIHSHPAAVARLVGSQLRG